VQRLPVWKGKLLEQSEETDRPRDPVVGVLLVHGLNGSLHDMAEVRQMLISHGILAESMLLPGHGSVVWDMIPLGWPEWSEAVFTELHALKQRCDIVFLIGHSLGGALCLHAAAHEVVDGVIAMCPPLHMYPWTLPAVRLARLFTPILPTIREDVRDASARRHYTRDVYRWTPMAPVLSMLHFLPILRKELARVSVPTLIFAAVHDHVVPVRDGRETYRLLASVEKSLVILRRSYHVVMKDFDREEVMQKTLDFVQLHARKRLSSSHP
jgi:carboxylesterase